ncbi:MAG: hypothetical protein ACXWK7_05785 [Caulobacteraceae bacterium]
MKAILRKVIVAVVAAAMLAASAAVMVVAAAMAIYGLLRPYLGGPGAAAVIVLVAGLLMLGVSIGLERWILKPGGKPGPADEQDLLQKLIGMAQEKPLIAAGALIGAIFLAIRNPALTAVVVKAFLDPKPRPGKKA